MYAPDRAPRILIVEDEPALGHLLIRALEWDGYEVVWVNGEAGLRAAKVWGKPYDLVVTDSRGPGVGGVDLIVLVQDLFPGLPVLHLDDLAQPNCESFSGRTLFKPFRLDSLSDAVRDILSERLSAVP